MHIYNTHIYTEHDTQPENNLYVQHIYVYST